MIGKVYLIPTVLHEEEIAINTLPPYLLDAVKNCDVFFVEQEKTARRFFKKLWKEMVIDDYGWHNIHKAEDEVKQAFINQLKAGKNIGIVSEAGCPGIADPGQILIASAQTIGAIVQPLIGPSSILLALMASGMNGQQFQFLGYLPIDKIERKKVLQEAENYSRQKNCTQIFIETPYRNNQLLHDILSCCKDNTRICVAVDITATTESILTKTVASWKKLTTDYHKRPAIFLLHSS